MKKNKIYVLAAGGTGGHLFPAISVAKILKEKGKKVFLFTDERAQKWIKEDYFEKIFVSNLKGPVRKWKKTIFGLRLLKCGIKSILFFIWKRPKIVVGFGGYPSAPTVLAAQWLGIPFILHECNASLGKANEMLIPKARAITTGFPFVVTKEEELKEKQIFVGNPIRENITHLANFPYIPPQKEGNIHLFIVGGSQGAELFSNVVPLAIKLLPESLRKRIKICEQVREEDRLRVERYYQQLGIETKLQPFFQNMEEILRWAHFIISRSGALTLAEISAAGLPSILVPLANSTTGDQFHNAVQYRDSGASVLIEECEFLPEKLRDVLVELSENPNDVLVQMSQAAREKFIKESDRRLVDEIIKIGEI